jgi:hypothetical protein
VSLTSELADPRSPLTIWLRGQLPNRAPPPATSRPR